MISTGRVKEFTEAPLQGAILALLILGAATMLGLADALNFPTRSGRLLLRTLRLRTQGDGVLRRLVPGWDARRRRQNFDLMMLVSAPEKTGLPTHLPQMLHAERESA